MHLLYTCPTANLGFSLPSVAPQPYFRRPLEALPMIKAARRGFNDCHEGVPCHAVRPPLPPPHRPSLVCPPPTLQRAPPSSHPAAAGKAARRRVGRRHEGVPRHIIHRLPLMHVQRCRKGILLRATEFKDSRLCRAVPCRLAMPLQQAGLPRSCCGRCGRCCGCCRIQVWGKGVCSCCGCCRGVHGILGQVVHSEPEGHRQRRQRQQRQRERNIKKGNRRAASL